VSQTTSTVRSRVRERLPFDVDALTDWPIRRFFIATLLGAFGMGVTFSLFVLFCTHIRHFPVGISTAMLGWEAVLGVAMSPFYGTIVDRHGPSIVLTVMMPIVSVGFAAIGFASTIPEMFGVATLIAAGGAGMWSAFNVLITRIVVEEHRQDAFGLNFMLLNVGIGIGVLIGTSIANLQSLHSFQVLYIVSGILSLADAAVLFSLRRFGGKAAVIDQHPDIAKEGWLTVLQDRRMVRFVGFSLVLMVCGYGSIEAGLPLFVTNVAHLSIHAVGILFATNTFTIIVAQLFVLAGIRGKSRSLLIGLVGLLWGASWLLATSSLFFGSVAAVLVLCVGQVVFAVGETVWQPVSPALVNELAPEHLRGRYNALVGIVWAVSSAIGASIAGVFFTFHAAKLWTVCLAVGAVVGGFGVTTMRRTLTPAEDGLEVASTA
jgi:MFS family permease